MFSYNNANNALKKKIHVNEVFLMAGFHSKLFLCLVTFFAVLRAHLWISSTCFNITRNSDVSTFFTWECFTLHNSAFFHGRIVLEFVWEKFLFRDQNQCENFYELKWNMKSICAWRAWSSIELFRLILWKVCNWYNYAYNLYSEKIIAHKLNIWTAKG